MKNEARLNSFDLVRFIAALLVIFSHSFALTGFKEPQIGNQNLGTVSVWVFFILSGFLITHSWKQYPRFNVFMAKRMLRIFPGLIAAIFVSIFTLGVLSTLGYKDYILNQQTLNYLNNILLINPVHSLPGVFVSNIYPSGVNGSLWTLAYEFMMYIIIALLGVASLLRKNVVVYIWLFLFAINIAYIINPEALSLYVFYLNIGKFSQLALMFFSGALLQIYNKNVIFSYYWAPALALFFMCTLLAPTLVPLFAGTLLAYGIIGFCKLTIFSRFGTYGDFSYGLYIYAFPVQQVISHLTQTRHSLKMFALSFVITLVLAMASWFFVESRFIRLKKRIKHEDYPLCEKREELAHAW